MTNQEILDLKFGDRLQVIETIPAQPEEIKAGTIVTTFRLLDMAPDLSLVVCEGDRRFILAGNDFDKLVKLHPTGKGVMDSGNTKLLSLQMKASGEIWLDVNPKVGCKASINLGARESHTIVQRALEAALAEQGSQQ